MTVLPSEAELKPRWDCGLSLVSKVAGAMGVSRLLTALENLDLATSIAVGK
jgi:hypothetical protein